MVPLQRRHALPSLFLSFDLEAALAEQSPQMAKKVGQNV